jgi:hypothetical protein
MAISIVQTPNDYASAHGDMLFVVSSNNRTEDNFKYVFQVEILGQIVATVKRWPIPNSGIGVFNAAPIVRSYLSNLYLYYPNIANFVNIFGTFFKAFTVRFGEEYGVPVTAYLDLTDASKYAWNYVQDFDIDTGNVPSFQSEQLTHWNNNFLSNMPRNKICAGLNDNLIISWLGLDGYPVEDIPAPPCEAMTADPATFSLPDAHVGVAYSYSFALGGSSATITSASGFPSWLSVIVDGSNNLVLSGTPAVGDITTGISIDVQVSNCGGSLEVSDTFDVIEDGRNIFFINNSGNTVTIQNSNGNSWAFGSGGSGNVIMPDANVTIVAMTGSHTMDFIQTMPSTIINSVTASAVATYTCSDYSNWNYLRVNA